LRTEDPRPRLQILTVSAGYVNTDLGPNALNANGTPIGCRDPGQVGGMSPEYAAKEIVAALEARQTELLLAPFLPRFLVIFGHLSLIHFTL
jgi:dehydrogenase/reductase SDR family member 7B